MTSFILIALLLTLASIIILARALLIPKNSSGALRQDQNIAIAREKLADLKEQVSNKAINQVDYESLKLEIETNLALDLELDQTANRQASDDQANQSVASAIVVTLLCCLIPVSATIVYFLTGNPDSIEALARQSNQSQAENQPSNNLQSMPEINEMVVSLEQRLADNPNDLTGWNVLARTYIQMRRYPDAVRAYKELLKLDGANANVFAGLADAAALQAGGVLQGQPSNYIEQALKLDPEHPQALWLAGLAQAQIGNQAAAIRYWETLLPLLSDNPAQQAELQDVITQASAASNATNTSASDVDANAPTESNTVQQLTVSVAIAESLQHKVLANDNVFVFARAQQGPPAPLAVKRLRVSDLPTTVVLTENDAMMPQLNLGLFENLTVSARVAKSGNPVAQPGDLQSTAVPTLNTNREIIHLIIEDVVQ